MLLVSFLLVGDSIGFGEKPVVEEPKTAVEETDTVATKPDVTEESGPPGEIVNSVGMKLKLIPAGEFMMGSPKPDDGFDRDEKPQHKVRITQPFYLGVYEVTKGQFQQFVEASGYKTEAEKDGEGGFGWNESKGEFEFDPNPKYTWRNTGFAQTDAHPVVNVSWNDAVAFCKWLSAKEGKAYRLPTEAEWEYTCRAGTRTQYQHGDDPEGLVSVGNVLDGTAKASLTPFPPAILNQCLNAKDGYVFTAPVGKFRANAFGLFDMHGNAWEWCQDWYAEDYYAVSPTDDPAGPETGYWRVVRGGGWWYPAGKCRSASRGICKPQKQLIKLSFRVAAVPSGK